MSNNDSKKKRKRIIHFSSLINNDRFLLIFSFVLSFFIWTAISINKGETVNYPVSDIPVTMELSDDAEDDNLTVVSINGVPVEDFKTTVKVKGNSVTVGSLTSSDIQVYGANLGNIVTSGSYNVTLQARQLGVKNNYDIISINPSEVAIVVDRTVSRELPIEAEINASSPPEYYMGSPALSEKTVTITGPEQSVSRVARAVVSYDVEKELTETELLENLDVVLFNAENEKIKDDSLTLNPITVNVTIPVLMKKIVPLVVDYQNQPSLFDASGFISIEPSEIEIAASSDVIGSIDSISIGTIDFSQLSYGTASQSFEIVMPEGVRNFNNVERAVVKFDFSDYSTKSFVITDFELINLPEGLVAEYSSYRNILVRIIGPKTMISNITASDVSTVIDLSGAKLGTSDFPVNVTINKNSSCWIYGSYDMSVTVSDSYGVSSLPQSSGVSTDDTFDNDIETD